MGAIKNATTIMTLVIGSGGALAGAVQGGINLFTFKASDLMESENKFSLLGINDTESWNDSWETYKFNNWDKPKDEWNIKDWKLLQEAPEEFKNICKSNANSRINSTEDPLYSSIISYCARPKKLSEAFEKEGIRLLPTEGHDDEWIDKYRVYWGYVDLLPKTGNEVSEISFNRLIEGCKALSNIETTNLDYERATDIAKFLCTE